mmetsp:Transcript_14537/g.59340  ORF Transcript_14537/g.59340 Transcript_14537/m.59340 type:complete len:225 (-) Transcript_14537:827-1501(-)
MMRSPPGCSGSHRLTSRTMPSITIQHPPRSLCSTTSRHDLTRRRLSCFPSRSAQYSASDASPNASAASASSSTILMSCSGGDLPSASASSQTRTLSNVAQSTSASHSARPRLSPPRDVIPRVDVIPCVDVIPRDASHSLRFPELTAGPSAPASRIARVNAMHGRSKRLCTGNVSPSLVLTATSSFAALSAAAMSPPLALLFTRRRPPPTVTQTPPSSVPGSSTA